MATRSQSRPRPQANPEVDFYSENHGSIYLLRSVSPVHRAIADGLVVQA